MDKEELNNRSIEKVEDITLKSKKLEKKILDGLYGKQIEKNLYLLEDKIIHTRDIETWSTKDNRKTVINHNNISSIHMSSSSIKKNGKIYGALISAIGLILMLIFGINVIQIGLENNILNGFILFIGGLMVLYGVNYLQKSREKIIISEGSLTYTLHGEESELNKVSDYIIEHK